MSEAPEVPPRLHQFNAGYDAAQDRIVLSLNTTARQEFRFWVTRRFLQLLWAAIAKMKEHFAAARAPGDPLLAAALTDLAEARATGRADFRTPYAGGTEFPLGDAPVLLHRLSIMPGPRNQQLLRLQPVAGAGIDLLLDEELTHVLTRLLLQAAQAADWSLDLDTGPAPGAAPPQAPRRLH